MKAASVLEEQFLLVINQSSSPTFNQPQSECSCRRVLLVCTRRTVCCVGKWHEPWVAEPLVEVLKCTRNATQAPERPARRIARQASTHPRRTNGVKRRTLVFQDGTPIASKGEIAGRRVVAVLHYRLPKRDLNVSPAECETRNHKHNSRARRRTRKWRSGASHRRKVMQIVCKSRKLERVLAGCCLCLGGC